MSDERKTPSPKWDQAAYDRLRGAVPPMRPPVFLWKITYQPPDMTLRGRARRWWWVHRPHRRY